MAAIDGEATATVLRATEAMTGADAVAMAAAARADGDGGDWGPARIARRRP